jgi:hypothetical protein
VPLPAPQQLHAAFLKPLPLFPFQTARATTSRPLARPSRASTTIYEANYPASNGITNDTGFIHSGSGAAQWYQVDLGATFAVGRVTVDNRAHCCQQRIGELFPTPTWNLPSLVHAHATALLHTSPSRHMLVTGHEISNETTQFESIRVATASGFNVRLFS